ncbi:hypothetical protein HNR23_003327 [Nocardiopsis mwathae]|uniref:Uncharacterized protein n=1 Tax=Nocardiopsis mwathae TaxID=1472723 RepID=A0A7X0D685_9ACTN|nr:hypothetical protein [Nocardiopsis mwathae]MBB6173267.1 hypothetical protein [Nocardiopsis mwathae]
MTSQPRQQVPDDDDYRGDTASLEAPEADVAEQRADVVDASQRADDWLRRGGVDRGTEVPEADAVEQHQEVGDDEDEYR